MSLAKHDSITDIFMLLENSKSCGLSIFNQLNLNINSSNLSWFIFSLLRTDFLSIWWVWCVTIKTLDEKPGTLKNKIYASKVDPTVDICQYSECVQTSPFLPKLCTKIKRWGFLSYPTPRPADHVSGQHHQAWYLYM